MGRPCCCDCVWYESGGSRPQDCANPEVLGLMRLVVGGRDLPLGVAAAVPRFSDALCGLDGRWFKGR